nr:MAG TPA: hypothetical protein [Caudoviricetes sp.]
MLPKNPVFSRVLGHVTTLSLFPRTHKCIYRKR